ncbi:hypothetical protein D3C79_688620 [compost metagenome]
MHRAQFVAHLGVQHQQPQGAAATFQAVAPRQLAQLGVGMVQQQVKVVALGDLAEHIAGGRADQRIQACPALPLLAGLFDFGGQGLVRLLAALVIGLLRAQFGALLFLNVEVLLELGQGLLQVVSGQLALCLGVMLLKPLLTLLQQHAGLFDGFLCVLQLLAQGPKLRIVDGQQAIEATVIQLGVLAAPLGDRALQLLTLLLQCLLPLGVGIKLGGQFHALGPQVLQALRGVGIGRTGLLQLCLQVLLPGFCTGMLA